MRGCLIERGRRLLLWGDPAARGGSNEGDSRSLLGELPLRRAASSIKGEKRLRLGELLLPVAA